MSTRHLVLALLLAPLLILAGSMAWRVAGTQALFPGLEPADVARIEIARGREQVVLAKRQDTGAWEILSAADAPGDAARIAAALKNLAGLRGAPLPPEAPEPRREPLEVRLSDRAGNMLAQAGFWSGEAAARPSGPRLALDRTPALPLWPSAWTDLQAPQIDVGQIEAVARLTTAGVEPLPAAAAGNVARILVSLSARDFVGGAQVNWAGARQLRATLADGSSIDLQQVPDGAGRYFLRMTSDTRTDVRAARRYAFRVEDPLP